MKQPYTMKVKGFGNRLKILYCYLTCMTQEDKIDTVLTHTSLKALFLKSMTLSWQNAYLLKVHTSNNFWQMILYFVQLQSITDNQMVAKASSASHSLDTGNNTNMCVLTMDMVAGFFFLLSEPLSWYWPYSMELNINPQRPLWSFGDFPVHLMSSHTWGNCFNNTKNKTSEG